MQCLSVAFGVATALAASEGALRLFATIQGPPRPNVRADAFNAPAVTVREIDENVSVAHYSVDGARLTGRAPQPDAPTVVLLGDSYIVAREVADHQTMGAVLERTAHALGHDINVRQYGWPGASPAQYLVEAPNVRARWGKSPVIIALSSNDFDARAVSGQWPRLALDNQGTASALNDLRPSHGGPAPLSVLAVLGSRQWNKMRTRAPLWARSKTPPATNFDGVPVDSTQIATLPRGVVRALARAYGREVALVYLAEVHVTDDDSTDAVYERALLRACRLERVTCASTRNTMLAARGEGVIVRGFPTGTLGRGHFNPAGHRLVAAELWKLLNAPPASVIAD